MRRGVSHFRVVIRIAVSVLLFSWARVAFAQPAPAAGGATAEQIAALRADLERLQAEHQERMAAIEARLAVLEGRAPQAAAAAPAAPLPACTLRGRARRRSSRLRRPHVEGVQPRHRRDRQLRGRRRPQRFRPPAVAPDGGGGGLVPGRRGPLRPRRLLPRVRARGRRDRGGLHHLPHAARRVPGEGRQAQGVVRQGEHAPRARPALGGSAARQREPAGRRGRVGGFGHLALAARARARRLRRGDRRGLPRGVGGAVRRADPRRPDLARAPARVPRPHRVLEPGARAARSYRATTAWPRTRPRGSSGWMRPSAGVRCAGPSIAASWRAPS